MKICRLGGLLLLLFCMHTTVYAQQVRTVRGRVQMLETGSERETIFAFCQYCRLGKRWTLLFVKSTASDKNSRFTLTYQPQKKKEYLLKVSFMGMQSFYRALGDSVSINAGTIVLKDDDLQIDEVVVTGKLRKWLWKEIRLLSMLLPTKLPKSLSGRLGETYSRTGV